MKGKRILWTIVLGIAVVLVTGSGWGYVMIKDRENARNTEMAILLQTFVQQYGDKAVIKQLVSPTNVYAAAWVDSDNVTRVSWNIGGLWVTVYNSR